MQRNRTKVQVRRTRRAPLWTFPCWYKRQRFSNRTHPGPLSVPICRHGRTGLATDMAGTSRPCVRYRYSRMLETGVEAHEIHQLERAHRMIESEFQGLVDVARRRYPLQQHVERFVAKTGVHPRRDESGRLPDKHRFLTHRSRDRFDRCERFRRRLERANDLDELHLVHRIEEVHAGNASRACVSNQPVL